MCSKCLMKEHLAVSYSIDNHTDARVEVKHYCRPDLFGYNQNLDDKVRASSVELMRNTLPSYLKKVVNLWTGEKVVILFHYRTTWRESSNIRANCKRPN